MSDITIPAAAIEAAKRAAAEYLATDEDHTEEKLFTAACRAMLTAWPGMRMMVDIDTGDDAAIKLPLPPQEASDDQ